MSCEPRNVLDPAAYAACFQRDGYYTWDHVISSPDVEQLRAAVAAIPAGREVRRKRSVYGVRNLLEICPAVHELATWSAVRQFVTPLLGPHAFAVRAVFFDKTRDTNWSLSWHQDKVVSLKKRFDVPGFVGWSKKAGVWQVQPPAEVLANMVAVRVHLDNCGTDWGPLRVLPGSHRHGFLDDRLEEWKTRVPEVVCTVGTGGVVTMCPLTLHASGQSESAGHRRVVHIEYAAEELPYGLQWNNRVTSDHA